MCDLLSTNFFRWAVDCTWDSRSYRVSFAFWQRIQLNRTSSSNENSVHHQIQNKSHQIHTTSFIYLAVSGYKLTMERGKLCQNNHFRCHFLGVKGHREVKFYKSESLSSDCRFRFLAKKYDSKVIFFFYDFDKNTLKLKAEI